MTKMPNAVYIEQQLPVQDHYFNYKRKYPFLFYFKVELIFVYNP